MPSARLRKGKRQTAKVPRPVPVVLFELYSRPTWGCLHGRQVPPIDIVSNRARSEQNGAERHHKPVVGPRHVECDASEQRPTGRADLMDNEAQAENDTR